MSRRSGSGSIKLVNVFKVLSCIITLSKTISIPTILLQLIRRMMDGWMDG